METNTKTTQPLWTYTLRLSMLVLLAWLLLCSCRKNNFSNEPQDAAAFNVVNASPGPLTINFFLNNYLVNGPVLAYTQESGYILATTGIRKFDATAGGSVKSLVTDTIELQKDKFYTIFISGPNTSLSTLVTEDDLSLPPSGKAKIRFIQLSPDGGTLGLGIKGGAVLFAVQAFKTVSQFIIIDPASYTFELESNGSAIDESTADLMAGKIYTVWAGGLKEGTQTSSVQLQISMNN